MPATRPTAPHTYAVVDDIAVAPKTDGTTVAGQLVGQRLPLCVPRRAGWGGIEVICPPQPAAAKQDKHPVEPLWVLQGVCAMRGQRRVAVVVEQGGITRWAGGDGCDRASTTATPALTHQCLVKGCRPSGSTCCLLAADPAAEPGQSCLDGSVQQHPSQARSATPSAVLF